MDETTQPSPDPHGVDHLAGALSLQAERERLERERLRLLDLDRRKAEFLAGVSHELRTPLAGIIGFSDLLLGEGISPLDRQQRECVEAIRRNGEILLAHINDLLDLATLDAGGMAIHPQPVVLAELFADLKAATLPGLDRAGMQVEWPLVAADATAVVDRRRLLQVLINLVDNARKYASAGGRLVLDCQRRPGRLVLGVADNGPGIPDEEKGRIFEPFRRGRSTAAASGGAGLGLAIARGIVDRHGGSIELEATAVRGCHFRILLPQSE